MPEKSRTWPWLLLGLFSIVLSWNVAEAGPGPYSVQVKAVPLEQRATALDLYRRLKANDYLAYHYMAPVRGQMWVRVRVGVFDTRQEAEAFGRALAEREELEYFVARSPVDVQVSGDTRLLITPSDAWVQRAGQQRVLFSTGTHTVSQMVDVAADISPSADRIATLHNDALVIYDAASGEELVRQDDFGSIMPRIRYSRDGQ